METGESDDPAHGEGATPCVTGEIDMRTKDALLLHRGITRRPKWDIPPAKRADILRAGYEALEWAIEQRDSNAVARLQAVFRAMEADNDKMALKLAEWDRLDAGLSTGRTDHRHLHAHMDVSKPEVRDAARTLHRALKAARGNGS